MQENNIKVIDRYIIFLSSALGKGSFGTVYRGVEKESERTVAVKQVSLAFINRQRNSEQLIQSLKNEILSMKISTHLHVVNLLDVKKSSNNLYLILEFCDQGSLEQHLQQKSNNRLSLSECLHLMQQLVSGFKHLREKNIVHRDLKPANILIHKGVLKIADFGFAKVDVEQAGHKTVVGSPLYMSPQVLKGMVYSNKCDIWSLGLIFYEMLFGDTPWSGPSLVALYNNIKTQPLVFPATEELEAHPKYPAVKAMIQQMLSLEEQTRISWEKLFGDPLFMEQKQVDKTWLKESAVIFQQGSKKDKLTQAKEFNQQYFLHNKVIRNVQHCLERQSFNNQLIQMFNKYIYEQKVLGADAPSAPENQVSLQKDIDFANMLLQIIEQQKKSKQLKVLLDWMLYKRNKVILLNNLGCLFYDLVFSKDLPVKTHLFYRFLFVLFKRQKIILYKLYIRIKSAQSEKEKPFSKDSWALFTSSEEKSVVYKFVKNDLVVVEQFFTDILAKSQTYIDQKKQQQATLENADNPDLRSMVDKLDDLQVVCNNNICSNAQLDTIAIPIYQELDQALRDAQKQSTNPKLKAFQKVLHLCQNMKQNIRYALNVDFDKIYEENQLNVQST